MLSTIRSLDDGFGQLMTNLHNFYDDHWAYFESTSYNMPQWILCPLHLPARSPGQDTDWRGLSLAFQLPPISWQ